MATRRNVAASMEANVAADSMSYDMALHRLCSLPLHPACSFLGFIFIVSMLEIFILALLRNAQCTIVVGVVVERMNGKAGQMGSKEKRRNTKRKTT